MNKFPFGHKAVNRPQGKQDVLDMLKGEKKTKSETNYRPGNNEKQTCHSCKFYEQSSQDKSPCSKVVGIVESSATCDLWAGGDGVPTPQPHQETPAHSTTIQIHLGQGHG